MFRCNEVTGRLNERLALAGETRSSTNIITSWARGGKRQYDDLFLKLSEASQDRVALQDEIEGSEGTISDKQEELRIVREESTLAYLDAKQSDEQAEEIWKLKREIDYPIKEVDVMGMQRRAEPEIQKEDSKPRKEVRSLKREAVKLNDDTGYARRWGEYYPQSRFNASDPIDDLE